MSEPLPPWDDLDELLDAERELPPIGRAAATRMSARLAAVLPAGTMGPVSGSGPADGAGGADGGGLVGGTSLPPDAGAIGATASAGGIGSALATFKVGLGLAIFGVGAAVGAAGHATWGDGRGERTVAAIETPATRASVAPPASVPEAPPAREAETPPPAASSARPTPSGRSQPPAEPTSGPRTDEALRSERTLVERARTAITRDDPAAALDALRTHRARFPRGELAEERDALEVRALRMQGDEAAARDAATRFRKAHPDSMLGDDAPQPRP